VLAVPFQILERFIQLSASAQVDYLEISQKFWKDFADVFIDGSSTLTSSDDHQHGFVFGEAGKFSGSLRIPLQEFLTDGSSCEDGFVCGELFYCLQEIAADFGR